MKKIFILVVGFCMFLVSCGTMATSSSGSSTGILGEVLGAMTNGETIDNVLSSVIGLDKLSARDLVGTWHYQGPGCAFTSNNLLAKAGGEVAATEIKNKLKDTYNHLGFSKSNTYITFNENGTFSAKIDGTRWNGNYTFDAKTQQIHLQGLLLSINGYTKRSSNGISILFESKKLLTLLQTLAAISGNSTAITIGDISKNYDGVRIGFEMK